MAQLARVLVLFLTVLNIRLRLSVSCCAIVALFSGCSSIGYGSSRHQPAQPQYYRVQSGDTLYSIGQKFKVPDNRLALVNGIRDPRQLVIGQKILIRYSSKSSVSDRSVVQKSRGDSTVGQKTPNAAIQTVAYRGPARAANQEPQPQYRDGRLAWPVGGGSIVSRFGPRNSGFHDGLDIAAPTGTPVFAAHSGIVLYSNNELNGFGNLLILREKSGMTTVYAHNSRLLVRMGETVTRGQKIALVGATGHASGAHLHFEVRTKDKRGRYVAVDPLPLFQKIIGHPRYRVNESLTPILARLF